MVKLTKDKSAGTKYNKSRGMRPTEGENHHKQGERCTYKRVNNVEAEDGKINTSSGNERKAEQI